MIVNGDLPTKDSAEVINMNAFDVKDNVNDAAIPERKDKKNVPINDSSEEQNTNTYNIWQCDTVITKTKVRKNGDVKTNFILPYTESED